MWYSFYLYFTCVSFLSSCDLSLITYVSGVITWKLFLSDCDSFMISCVLFLSACDWFISECALFLVACDLFLIAWDLIHS